jgi:hypothetical protein
MATTKSKIAIRENSKRDPSPDWTGHEAWDTNRFLKQFYVAMEWYRLETSIKDLKPKVINWMAANEYTKTEIAEFKKTKDNRCPLTVGAIAANLLRGMPVVRTDWNQGRSTETWLRNAISKIVAEGKYDTDEADEIVVVDANKPAVYVPSIQERVKEASFKMTEEIETALEAFSADPEAFEPKAFKVLNLLKGKEAKAAHARIIKGFYERQYNELVEVATTKDEQLKEGYSHISKANLKKITAFYNEILTACDMLMQEAKINRVPRKTKTVSRDKLVAKLKYLKANEPLKLVSINPVDIIGSKELWVFNTKSRKLGKYIAGEFNDLGVKGTTITGFDEFKSVQKTLRKPEDQLKEFKAAGKVQLRKFLEDIKAVDIKLNGRISEEVILLRAA